MSERHNVHECHNNAHHKGCDREGCSQMRCPACHKEMMADYDLISKQKDKLSNTYLRRVGYKTGTKYGDTTSKSVDEQAIAEAFMAALKAENQ